MYHEFPFFPQKHRGTMYLISQDTDIKKLLMPCLKLCKINCYPHGSVQNKSSHRYPKTQKNSSIIKFHKTLQFVPSFKKKFKGKIVFIMGGKRRHAAQNGHAFPFFQVWKNDMGPAGISYCPPICIGTPGFCPLVKKKLPPNTSTQKGGKK